MSLVTVGFAVVNVASINLVSIPSEVSATVFDDFDTVLELLEVCLACMIEPAFLVVGISCYPTILLQR